MRYRQRRKFRESAISTYARYDEAAPNFDKIRPPIGAEIIAGWLAGSALPLAEMTLLDAGCGTGAYAATLVGKVGRVEAVDISEGMLSIARGKLGAHEGAGRIGFHRASIDALPFVDASFDAVMFNQCLHHLEPGNDPTYGGHGRALAEAQRVLRPGGRLVVNMVTHHQLRKGFWYYGLIPEAVEACLKRCISDERLLEILGELGFAFEGRTVPLDAVMLGEAHFDPRGPLKPAWRDSDSIWALAPSDAVARAERRVRALDRGGQLESYLAEHDAPRRTVGQYTFFLATKT